MMLNSSGTPQNTMKQFSDSWFGYFLEPIRAQRARIEKKTNGPNPLLGQCH